MSPKFHLKLGIIEGEYCLIMYSLTTVNSGNLRVTLHGTLTMAQ